MKADTTAIILAAGKSKRLGQHKALLKLGDHSLIHFLIERLEFINLDIVIVTNKDLCNKLKRYKKLGKISLVVPENTKNRTGNLIAGIKSIKNLGNILVVPVDRPGWSINTVQKLLKMKETCCPEFEGRGGHPLFIHKSDVMKLVNYPECSPLNQIFNSIKIKVKDPELHLNIDTEKDISDLKKFYENNIQEIR